LISPAPISTFDWRTAAGLFAAGAALRLGLLALIFTLGGQTCAHYLTASDAESYLRFARVVFTGAPADTLTLYDSRVFPGWPLAYGWLLLLAPAPVVIFGATVACAAAVPVAAYALTRCRATALALLCLPPAWLLATVHPIAEAFYLLTGLLALIAWRTGRLALSGFAVAAMVASKPYGAFLLLPLALAASRAPGRWSLSAGLRFLWPVALVGGACAALNHLLYRDVLRQLHVYASPLASLNLAGVDAQGLAGASGHWSWPLQALVQTPRFVPVPLWKLVYIYGHVLALAVLFFRPAWQLWRTRSADPLTLVLLAWFAGNSAAILCGGPYWGFHSFDRYFLWSWPAALLLNADLVRAHPRWVLVGSLASIALTLFAVNNHRA
jgi:hypothetical protein